MLDGGLTSALATLNQQVVVPSSWDELAEHIVMGFAVNTFSWAQAAECLASPTWSFIHMIVAILSGSQIVGLAWAVVRDRHELKFVEALVQGHTRSRTGSCPAPQCMAPSLSVALGLPPWSDGQPRCIPPSAWARGNSRTTP